MARVAAAVPEGFSGFGKGALRFLDALSENNNRDWFQANRETYETEVLAPLTALVGSLAFVLQAHDIALTGDPKRSVFRIYRDVRFSKNKLPYKTNASCVLSRDGSKDGVGILYVQIGGGAGPFAALGFYDPAPEDLTALRQAIVRAPKAWAETQARLEASGLKLSREHALVRIPKGFEAQADTKLAGDLRLKSFVVRRSIEEGHVFGPALIDDVLGFAQDGAGLLAFGRSAIDRGRVERA